MKVVTVFNSKPLKEIKQLEDNNQEKAKSLFAVNKVAYFIYDKEIGR